MFRVCEPEGDHTKVCEVEVNSLGMLSEDGHAQVRAIVDKGFTQLKEWLDSRLHQQEENLRSLLASQEKPAKWAGKGNLKMELDRRLSQSAARKQASSQAIGEAARKREEEASKELPLIPEAQVSSRSMKTEGMALDDQASILTGAQRQSDVSQSSVMTRSRVSLDAEQVWVANLMELFDQLDMKGTGTIDLSELQAAFKETGLSEVQALDVFRSMDESENGTIDRLEWLHIVSHSARGSEGDTNLLKEFLKRLVQLQHSHGSIYQAGRARRTRLILRHDSVWRMAWDMVLILLLCYVALSLPFTLGFGSSTPVDVIDFAVDIFFCWDVVLNFRTSYVDKDETIVVDWTKIAKRYLKSWFCIDFLASVPWDYITKGFLPNLTPVRLLKIGKIAKVLKLLRFTKFVVHCNMNTDSERLEKLKIKLSSKAVTRFGRMVKLVLIAFLVAHWLTCFSSAVDSQAFAQYFDGLGQAPDTFQKYLAGMYWAMTTISTVGYGDITPVSDAERAFSMIAMVIGGALYGFVIGSVTSIVTEMDVHTHAYYERMEVIQSWLDRHPQIELILRRKLRKHFKCTLAAKTVVGDDYVIDQLSGELRGDVAWFLIPDKVRTHPMVENLTKNALAELVYVLQEVLSKAHEFVVRSGDPGIGMYFLVQGLARYDQGTKWQPPGAANTNTRYRQIVTGDSFGEEIIFGEAEVYSYTVITVMDCTFNFIDEDHFKEHFKNLPELEEQMRKSILQPSISPQLYEM